MAVILSLILLYRRRRQRGQAASNEVAGVARKRQSRRAWYARGTHVQYTGVSMILLLATAGLFYMGGILQWSGPGYTTSISAMAGVTLMMNLLGFWKLLTADPATSEQVREGFDGLGQQMQKGFDGLRQEMAEQRRASAEQSKALLDAINGLRADFSGLRDDLSGMRADINRMADRLPEPSAQQDADSNLGGGPRPDQ